MVRFMVQAANNPCLYWKYSEVNNSLLNLFQIFLTFSSEFSKITLWNTVN